MEVLLALSCAPVEEAAAPAAALKEISREARKKNTRTFRGGLVRFKDERLFGRLRDGDMYLVSRAVIVRLFWLLD